MEPETIDTQYSMRQWELSLHLPTHLREAQMWDDLCDVLTDFDFLQDKIGAVIPSSLIPHLSSPPHTVFDLLRDFQNALAALPTDDPEWEGKREEVATLYRAIDENSYVLKEDPSCLVQQVYNARDWDGTTVLGQRVNEAAENYPRPWLKRRNRLATT